MAQSLHTRGLLLLNSLTCSRQTIREMSRVKKRFTMPPFWQPKKTRVLYPEDLTPQNTEFLDQVVEEANSKSLLKTEVEELGTWTPESRRCGLITRKIGIYPMWLKDGTRISTTLVQVVENHVIKYITPEELIENDFTYQKKKPGRVLGALIVGSETADPRLFTKEYFNLFRDAGVLPKKRLTKFFVSPDAKLPPGTQLFASHFRPGDYVDCHCVTIDRGFQGVMKRWGFHGMPASHGVTKSHRRGGNIGGGGEKARVWPGTKMPGHMGRNHRDYKGLKIWRVNTKHNVLWLQGGCVPGETGNYVLLYDSLVRDKRLIPEKPPHFPTFFPGEELPDNIYEETVHAFGTPSIIFPEDKKDKKKRK